MGHRVTAVTLHLADVAGDLAGADGAALAGQVLVALAQAERQVLDEEPPLAGADDVLGPRSCPEDGGGHAGAGRCCLG